MYIFYNIIFSIITWNILQIIVENLVNLFQKNKIFIK